MAWSCAKCRPREAQRADFVIPAGLGRRATWVTLKKAVRKMQGD